MTALLSFASWFFDHIILIMLSVFVLWKGKMLWESFVVQPLRGGNGVVSMNELAKYILIVILVYMVYREGEVEGPVYPESVFWAVIVGVALVGGIKEFANVLTLKK